MRVAEGEPVRDFDALRGPVAEDVFVDVNERVEESIIKLVAEDVEGEVLVRDCVAVPLEVDVDVDERMAETADEDVAERVTVDVPEEVGILEEVSDDVDVEELVEDEVDEDVAVLDRTGKLM